MYSSLFFEWSFADTDTSSERDCSSSELLPIKARDRDYPDGIHWITLKYHIMYVLLLLQKSAVWYPLATIAQHTILGVLINSVAYGHMMLVAICFSPVFIFNHYF